MKKYFNILFSPAWLNPIPTPTSEVSSGGKSRTLGYADKHSIYFIELYDNVSMTR